MIKKCFFPSEEDIGGGGGPTTNNNKKENNNYEDKKNTNKINNIFSYNLNFNTGDDKKSESVKSCNNSKESCNYHWNSGEIGCICFCGHKYSDHNK